MLFTQCYSLAKRDQCSTREGSKVVTTAILTTPAKNVLIMHRTEIISTRYKRRLSGWRIFQNQSGAVLTPRP